MADIAHQEGNNYYRKGDLEGAAESYALAARLDPTDPKFNSNLSAVYYEQGRYIDTIDAIRDSWRALREKNHLNGQPTTPPATDPLAAKLSLRYMKAKLNGLAARQLSLHDRKPKKRTPESNWGIENDIEVFLERIVGGRGEGESKHLDLAKTWGVWKAAKEECAGHSLDECQAKIRGAEKHFRALPIFKAPLDPVFEYYRFGHDPIRSLLHGIDGQNDNFLLDQNVFLQEQWRSVSFLFGGCGDARHAFGTLIHFADVRKELIKLGRPRHTLPKLNLTLVDIHPAALARVMLVFALVRKSTQASTVLGRLETESAAFYAWSGLFMPEYCAAIIASTAQDVISELNGKTDRNLTKSWSVDDETRTRLLPMLEYWSKPLQKSTKRFFELNGPTNLGLFTTLNGPKTRSLARNTKFLATVEQLGRMGLVDAKKDVDFPLYNNCEGEERLYDEARILLPPKPLLGRHPKLAEYVKSEGRSGKGALVEEVMGDWKPNPTLFDNWTTEHLNFGMPGGYPMISSANPFQTYNDMINFLIPFRGQGELNLDQTSFSIFQQLFDSMRKAVELLDTDLTVEFLCSELYSGLARLVEGDLDGGVRNAKGGVGAPKKYLRMWLSNTPDYTGSVLSNIVYLTPYLDVSKHGMMFWNCLLNPISFSNLRGICYHYTNLTPTDVRRIFSCLLRDPDQRKPLDEFNLFLTPRTKLFANSITRKELFAYLTRLLLRVVCPAQSGVMPGQRVDEPINLITFFRLLAYLVQMPMGGCPAHWVGDFVQSVVEGSLVSDVRVWEGTYPLREHEVSRPLNESRKLSFESWRMEIETILGEARGAFPFRVQLPSVGTGKVFSTRVKAIEGIRYTIPLHTRAVWLVFWRPGSDAELLIHDFSSRVHELVEAHSSRKELQILTAQEAVDLSEGYVSWKMDHGWFERMRDEKWKLVVYVTNLGKAVSNHVGAARWQEGGADVLKTASTSSRAIDSRNADRGVVFEDLD